MRVAMPALIALTAALAGGALVGAAGPAAAACRCVCYQGRAEARCLPTDLVPPICQNLCLESASRAPLRGDLGRPLAGGGQILEPVTPSDPNWQAGPERGAYTYGSDPATGNAPTGSGAAGLGR